MTDAAENLDNLDQSSASPEGEASNDTPGTIIDNPDAAGDVQSDRLDKWRDIMADGDEKERSRLDRFNSISDVWKSYKNVEAKLSSRKTEVELSDDPTEEELKTYREAKGIPESPEKYDLSFEDGMVIGDEDKPTVDEFLKHAHSKNYTNDQVKDVVSWFVNDRNARAEQISEQNEEYQTNSIAELKSEWGGEYKANINAINSLFVEAPEGIRDALFGNPKEGIAGALDANMRPIGNNPNIVRWLVGLAKQLNPAATLVPPGVSGESGIKDEIGKIEKMMHSQDATEKAKYWKDPAMQKRYLDLINARDRAK